MVIGSITKKYVKQAVCRILWRELKLKDYGFPDWQSLLVSDFKLPDLGLDDIYKKSELHNTIEKELRVHLLCREFESTQTISDIVEVVCFKKGIK